MTTNPPLKRIINTDTYHSLRHPTKKDDHHRATYETCQNLLKLIELLEDRIHILEIYNKEKLSHEKR